MAKRRGATTISQMAARFTKALEDTPTAEDVARQRETIEVLPTGLPVVDWGVFGIGGLPFGFGVEVFGKEGSGKTLFAIHMCAQYHKLYEGDIYWVDSEGSHVPHWMARNGMDLSRTKIAHSLGSAEKYEQKIQAAIAGGVKLIVLDSAASMLPESIQHADSSALRMDQKNEQPQFMTNMLMRIEAGWPEAGLPSFADSGAIFIIINHTNRFQEDDFYKDSKGAAKIKHFCRIRVNIEARGLIRDHDGKPTFKPPAEEGVARIQCLKNQLALPACESVYHVNLVTGEMWDDVESIIELGKRKGTLEIKGAWYNHGKSRWNGKEKLAEALINMPELANRICAG